MMKKIFQTFSKFILDTLFPIKCAVCQKEGAWICQKCQVRIKLTTEHVCGICEKVSTPDGRTCLACKKKGVIDGLLPAASYGDSQISKAIHLFKYRFVQDLSQELGDILVSAIKKTDLPLPDAIIPVPLHPRRLRWRGFNQSLLLAKHLSENLLPFEKIKIIENNLIRHRYTSPQKEITDYICRKQNLAGAFSLTDLTAIKDKIILLVDDVSTTGSTIFECAKLLKASGAKEVFAVVIARQEVRSNK